MEYIKRYTDFLNQFLDVKRKIKVVFDCSDGAAGPVVKELVKSNSDIDAVLVNDEPNGDFPSHGPNPLAQAAQDALSEKVIEEEANLGIVFDSDGDRVFFCDEKGEILNSFDAFNLISEGSDPPYVVSTIAFAPLTLPNTDVIEEKVGRYFIIKAMQKNKASLGAEHTGHFYFKDFFYSDSGLLAAIYMINFASGVESLNETVSSQSFIRSEERNFKIEDAKGVISKIEEAFRKEAEEIEKKDGIMVYFKDHAFNVRPSNTEPLVRLNAVAKTKEELKKTLKEVEELINS